MELSMVNSHYTYDNKTYAAHWSFATPQGYEYQKASLL